MKATELRIGNWVNFIGDVEAYQVTKIVCDTHGDEIEVEFCDEQESISLYSAIPLTEEWLVKFGFELFDYEECIDDEEFIMKDYKLILNGATYYYTVCHVSETEFQFGIKVTWAEQMILSNINFVHQLQNLYFALTGEELTLR